MKKYGKLIIAFMWLGLTMIMIVGATFAWFSENRTVEAEGMSVNAEVSKNLLIAYSEDNPTYAFSAATGFGDLVTLSPSSTTNLSAFYATTDGQQAEYSGALKSGASLVAVTPVEDLPDNGDKVYVAQHTFLVKAEGDDLGKLYVESVAVTRGDTTSAITPALRIAVKCGSLYFIYAPYASNLTYNGINGTSANNTASVTAKAAPATTGTLDYLTASNVTTSGVTVVIYIWYEGQDTACTSANSVNVEDLAISVKLAAEEPAA